VRRIALLLPLLAGLTASPAARAGNLHVAGQQSGNVIEYDASDGSPVRTFAEGISEGFLHPGGIAIRPSDGALYVTSRATGEIWRYTTSTGQVETPRLVGGLSSPAGAAFDASGGTLYFAAAKDALSETVDAVKSVGVPGGALATLGSTADADFVDVAVNATHVFASDADGDRIVRFPVGGGSGTTVIGSGLDEPNGIVLSSAGAMLIADRGSDRVLEYQLSGGSWSFQRVVLPVSAGVIEPCGLALAPDGHLSVSGCLSNDVVRVDLTSLVATPLVAPGSSGLASPKDLAWSGSTLLVASAPANAVVYFDSAGSATGVRALGLSPPLDGGLAFAPGGERLAAVSLAGDAVIEYDAESALPLRTARMVCAGALPFDAVYGPGGDLYVSCLGGNGVARIDADTGEPAPFVLGGAGGLIAPRGLAFGPNGDLLVSSVTGEVLAYDGASGAFAGVFVDATGNGGGPIDPYALLFQAGRLYVASGFPSEVKAYDAASGAFVSTFVPSGSGGLDTPTGLDFGPDGDLYVTSQADDAVRRYDGTSGAFVEVFVAAGAGGIDAPLDLAFRPAPPLVPALPGGFAALLAAALAAAGRLAGRGRAGRQP